MQNFHPTGSCPIRDIISHLSSKWSMLIMVTLNANEIMRFNDIQRSIGDISQRMLTVTLRALETDGLVTRTIYPEVPPRVEYKLTERGISLIPLLKNLVDWSIANTESILKDRKSKEDKQAV